MQIVNIKLSDIKPYENNPRRNDQAVEAVAESIKQCGYIAPIIVDEDNVILAGHTRYKALKKLGRKEAECIVKAGLTEEQKRKYRLLDNKTNEFAEWDLDLLADELEGLDFGDFDFGFDLGEDEEPPEVTEDEYDAEPPAEPKAKLGDIYQLGRHRLMCGDSTDRECVEKLMDGLRADLCFHSPPYNIGKNAQLNDRDDDNKYIGYDDDNAEWLELLRCTTENAMQFSKYVGINVQFLSGNKTDFISWLYEFKNKICDIAIWYKDNVAPAMAKRVMNSSFEFIVFMSELNNSRAIGTKDFRGTFSNVYQSHIQHNNEFSEIHSATYPIEFVSHYINGLTEKSQFVLDLFGGTGTTLIASEQLDRTCYMMELDPRYVDVIIDRWEKFTGQTAKLISESG